jgi:hypothetical protein
MFSFMHRSPRAHLKALAAPGNARISVMIPSVETKCATCETPLVVVPPTIGQFRLPTDEPARVQLPNVPDGGHLVEADRDGRFVCLNCQTQGEVPELRLIS